jgi:hypothetical protein
VQGQFAGWIFSEPLLPHGHAAFFRFVEVVFLVGKHVGRLNAGAGAASSASRFIIFLGAR